MIAPGETPRASAWPCSRYVATTASSGVERLHHANGHAFLADVEVQETADFLLGVKLRGFLLEMPDQQHLPQQEQRMFAGRAQLR